MAKRQEIGLWSSCPKHVKRTIPRCSVVPDYV